ncbi:glycosyltransferase [Litoribacter populi]|uniref:glycosyltransferase n=1 Tax=Litoribacter populi TaxID=2598460 RepID=UPI0011816CD9|nr:glycosyltransferase [Litoribacter populi]
MISIIICSVNQKHLDQISQNISQTIGVEYELLAIDNSKNPKGITSIYNEGAKRAKYEYLCFVHEDVLFETMNWGEKVSQILRNKSIGLVGIAGSVYKSLAPSGWYLYELNYPAKAFQKIRQAYKFQDRPARLVDYNPSKKKLNEVICIDGVWFCTTKSVINDIPFDESFDGFHGYDVDFSLAVAQKYKVMVTFDVLLTHFSEGRFDRKWLDATLKVQEKWNHCLPFYLSDVPKNLIYKTEKGAFKKSIKQMLDWGYSFGEIKTMLDNARKSPFMKNKLFFKLYFYLIKKRLFYSLTYNRTP